MANISISQMNTRAEANLSDLHEVAYADSNSQTGYASGKMTMEVMANAIVNEFTYQSLGNRKISKAIEDAEVTVDTALSTSSQNPIANAPVAEAIEDINTDLQSSQTVSSESGLVTIQANGSNLSACTTTLAPIQDLHGYDYPWVGGAGKNLFGFEEWLKSKNVTYTKQGNAYTLTANYLVGSSNYWEFSDTPINVTLSATVENGTATNVGFRLKNTVNVEVSTKGTYITMVANAVYIDWSTSGTVTITEPQIELGNQATSYAPYSNICPISGYDSAEYTRTGVNIWDEEWEYGYWDVSNGQFVSGGYSWIGSKNYIPCIPTTTYYAKCDNTLTSTGFIILMYDKDKNYIGVYNNGLSIKNTTFTTIENCYYLTFYIAGAYASYPISINYPSTITTYQPYQAQNVTLTFDNTVYSGVIDWISGVVTVDKAMDIYDGSEDEGWNKYGSGSASAFAMYKTKGDINGNVKCNYLNVIPDSATWGDYDSWLSVTGSIIVTGIKSITSVADWKTYLSNNNLQVLYELATPTAIQLTPTQLTTLKGTNTISTPQGSISLTYQPDNVIGELKKSIDDVEREIPSVDSAMSLTSTNPLQNKVIASELQGVVEASTEGQVLTLSNCAGIFADDVSVSIEPVQDLSNGDPSPTNICPITGYDDVSVTTTDEDETTTNTITATFDNTVYSGHVDFTSGIVTVDKAVNVYDGSSDEQWVYWQQSDSVSSFQILNMPNVKTSGFIGMNMFKELTIEEVDTQTGFLNYTDTTLRVFMENTLGITTLADWKTYLSNNNLQVLYELATPQTIQLTPQQLQMLKGYNTVTTDANGGMTVRYQPDNVVGECKEYAQRLYDLIVAQLS